MWPITFQRSKSLPPNSIIRSLIRLRHKAKTEEKDIKVAPDVLAYLENNPEYQEIKERLPKSLLRKYGSPQSMYLINTATAKEIALNIKDHLDDSPVVEVNPGLGLLSEELIKYHRGHLHMYEMNNYFSEGLNNLQKKYPDRFSYKIGDFFGMWKLSFRDKMDGGNRVKEFLGDLATEDNDRTIKVIGATPGLSFIKQIISNIVFHHSSNHMGRPDFFITMPGHRIEYLTDNEIQLGKHRSLPALFQLLFDHKELTTVPIVHYLPWTHRANNKTVTMMDEHSLYLVNITLKKKLPCPPEYLPLMWYFFKPLVLSKCTRVIPMLEQWIPGCGVWLITGQDPPDSNRSVAPGPEDEALPHMTIFTQFGDLTLGQKLTVFKKFVSWPEFEHCQFRNTMENNLPKTVSLVEDDKDITHVEDISEDTYHEHSDSE